MKTQSLLYLRALTRKSVFLLLLLSGAFGKLQSQTITIPLNNDNDQTTQAPYGCSDAYSRTQALYRYSEIGVTGNITKVGFYVNSINNPLDSTPVVIKMKNTKKNEVEEAYYNDASLDAVTVFNGKVANTQLANNAWVTVTLDDSFTYAGYNLEVFVEVDMGFNSREPWDGKQMRWSETGSSMAQVWTDWVTIPSFLGNVRTQRPNIRFTIVPAPAMSYVSSEVFQDFDALSGRNAVNQKIIGIKVKTKGLSTPLSLTTLNLSTDGSGLTPGMIKNAKVYFTNISSLFDTTQQFGSTVLSPNGTFSVTGSQTLDNGLNYFWLTYDLGNNAPDGDSLDAECVDLVISSVTHTPTVTSPAGYIKVGNIYYFDTPSTQYFLTQTLGVKPNKWQKGAPSYVNGPSAYSGTDCWGTNLTGDYSPTEEYVLISPAYASNGGPADISYMQWFDFAGTYNNVEATFEYQVNNGPWLVNVNIDNQRLKNSGGKWQRILTQIPTNAGDTIKFRWHFKTSIYSTPAAGWYIDDFITTGLHAFDQAYSSGDVEQVKQVTYAGFQKQAVIGIAVTMNGSENAKSITEFNLSTLGSTVPNIISSARMYYSGIEHRIDTTTQFGSAALSPNGSFTITGSQTLMDGTNYFWLVYDIMPSALLGDSVDGICNAFQIGGIVYAPLNPDPAGNIPVGYLYEFEGATNEGFTTRSFNIIPSQWERGTPTLGPSAAYSGNNCWGTDLDGTIIPNTDFVLTSPHYAVLSNTVSVSYKQWFDFTDAGGSSTATFEYQINNSGSWNMLNDIPDAAQTSDSWEDVVVVVPANPGDTVVFRWHFTTLQYVTEVPGWYIDNFLISGMETFNQIYDSCIVTQSERVAYADGKAQTIIKIAVSAKGSDNALNLSDLQFTTANTATGIIESARVFYTGGIDKFDSTTQYGNTVAAPSGAFNVSGSVNLSPGVNYFWLTYDLSPAALVGDSVQAVCSQFTLGGLIQTPSQVISTHPATVGIFFNFDTASYQDFTTLSLNGNENQWEKGKPFFTNGPAAAYSGTDCWGTNLTGTYNRNSDYAVISYPFVATSSVVSVNYTEWFDFAFAGNTVYGDFEYSINGGPWDIATSVVATYGNSLKQWQDVATTFAVTPGDTVQVRWHFRANFFRFGAAAGWYFDNFIVSGMVPFDQVCTGSGIKHLSALTAAGVKDHMLSRITVEMAGTMNPKSLSAFEFNTIGSGTTVSLDGVKIYYTGTRDVFDTLARYGSVTAPGASFVVTGTQELSLGTNYFWVTGDVNELAVIGDSLKFNCTLVTAGPVSDTPDYSPDAKFIIGRLYDFDTTSNQHFSQLSLNGKPALWQRGVPAYANGPAASSGTSCWGTNLTGNYGAQEDQTLTTPPYVTTTADVTVAYQEWFNYVYLWNDIRADFEYQINNGGWVKAIIFDNSVRFSTNGNWENVELQVNTVPGDTIQFRWHFASGQYVDYGAGWYIDNFMISGMETFNQFYLSSDTRQYMSVTSAGTKTQPIISVMIEANGTDQELDLTALEFNTAGTGIDANIESARVFYTGNRKSFDSLTQYGSAVTAPSGAFSVTGSQLLSSGTNHFWLVYDVSAAALVGDSLDATCTQITFGTSTNFTPLETNPEGYTPIGHLYTFDTTSDEEFTTQSISNQNEWERGIPTYGPAAAYSGANCWGTSLTGPYTINSEYALVSPTFVATGPVMMSYKQWFDFMYTSWSPFAQFEYQVNNSGGWMMLENIDITSIFSSQNQWENVEIALGGLTAGDTLQFRWRIRTNQYDAAAGWYIDNFLIGGAELVDDKAPLISYTVLPHTSLLTNRTLTDFATITDMTGVDSVSPASPRVYFKKKSDANVFAGNNNSVDGWKYVEATNTASPFSFTLDYNLLFTSVVLSDTIEYFVVAQDLVPAPSTHVGANPADGFSATTVDHIISAPYNPNSYIIVNPPLAGPYNVGVGQAYTTITSAIADMELRGVSAPVTFVLTDTAYNASTGETFPLTIRGAEGISATNTVTFKPNTGVNTEIRSNNAIFKLRGADHIIIDGSNNGTDSRNLTLHGLGNSAPVWICADDINNGATWNTIKNTIIKGEQVTRFGIYAGGNSSTSTNEATIAANSNNTYSNNYITRTQFGMYFKGETELKTDKNNTITKNIIGDATNGISSSGIFLNFQQGTVISDNIIQNIAVTSNTYYTIAGVHIDQAKQITITGNNIYNMNVNTGYSNIYGIFADNYRYQNASNPSELTIANNFISDMHLNSVDAYSMSAININGGYSDRIYYNSVSLTGLLIRQGGQVFGLQLGYGVQNFDVRNNIFSITGNSASTFNSRILTYYISNTGSTGISNYNVFNCTPTGAAQAILGSYSGTDYTTIAGWRTGTGYDLNSGNFVVNFVSANDLHLAAPSIGDVNLIGTPLAGFTTDKDGDIRHTTFPYAGADENTGAPLPVKLLAFKANASGNTALLTWSTASETNSKQFVVERRAENEKAWSVVGTVKAAGNSSSVREYRLNDDITTVKSSVIHYRLKMVDRNESFEYSGIVSIYPKAEVAQASLNVYPNPFVSEVNISVTAEENGTADIRIFDLTGKEVRTAKGETVKGNNLITIDTDMLQSGIYFLSVEVNGTRYMQKLIK